MSIINHLGINIIIYIEFSFYSILKRLNSVKAIVKNTVIKNAFTENVIIRFFMMTFITQAFFKTHLLKSVRILIPRVKIITVYHHEKSFIASQFI